MQIEESKIRLSFSNSDGLKTGDGGPIKGFALAGEKGEEFVAGGQFRVFFGRQIHSFHLRRRENIHTRNCSVIYCPINKISHYRISPHYFV